MNDQNTVLAWYIFVADPRSNLSRDAINEFQVHLILLKQYPAFLSIEDIAAKINSYSGCFSMSVMSIEKALNNSLNRTPSLIDKTGNSYQLTEERKRIIEKVNASYKESKRVFGDHVISCIESEYANQLKDEDRQKIIEILEPILVDFFNKRVLELDRVKSVPTFTMDTSFEKTEFEEWEEVINYYLKKLELDLIVKEVIKTGIKKALSEIPADGKRYVAAVHNKVFCTMFSIPEPSIIHKEKKMLRERRLYLDTNVIIKAVFENSTEHQICKELLARCSDFNIQMFISDFTKGELDTQREKAKKHYLLFEQKKAELLPWIKKTGSSPILRTYLNQKLSNPSLTIDAFLTVYDPWDEYLFEKYGILLESECCERITEIPQDERDIVYKHIKKSKSKYFEPKHEAIDHDVNQFFLGHLLRKKYSSDEFGSKVWVITTDRGITTRGQKYLKFKYEKPVFKLVEEWLERLLYITTVDLEDLPIEKYIDLIVNTELGAIYEDPSIDIDFTATLLDSNLPIDELRCLPPEHASRAISRLQEDKEVEQLVEKAKTVSSHELPGIHELFREKVLKAVHNEKESTQKMEVINSELKQMRENIQTLTEEIEKKNDSIRKRDEELTNLKKEFSTLKKNKNYIKYGVLILGIILILILLVIFSGDIKP